MNRYRWSDLRVGLGTSFEVEITSEMVQRFVELCGDVNPLHMSDEEGRRRGFPGKVVHGLLTASHYSTLVGVHLPGEFCLLHGIDVSLVKPVFVGDRLTVKGEISYLNDSYRQAHLSAQMIRSSDGQTVSRAKIKVGLHE